LIRTCSIKDTQAIFSIVNDAATAYDGHIPEDCYHQPYMPLEEVKREMKRVTFFGYEEDGRLIGVMGIEPVKDVSLVRHAYVLTGFQGKGTGSKLLQVIEEKAATTRLLVGTWADATWALDFYRKHGFKDAQDKDRLLKTYWDIPARQIETSVVLEKVLR